MHTALLRPGRFIENYHQWIVGGLIVLLVYGGILYSFYLQDAFRYHDEEDYYTVARFIAASGEYFNSMTQGASAFRPIGYPAVLTLVVFLGGEIIAARILNFVFFGLTLFFLYHLLKGHVSAFAGFFGALLTAGYPVLFYTASTLYPQTLGALLIVLCLYLTFQCRLSWGIAVLAGLVAGWLVLTLPVTICLLPIGLVWVYWIRRPATKYLLAMILSGALVVGGWTARNYSQFNSFVLVSTNSGLNLLLGNSKNTTYNSGTEVDIRDYLPRQRLGSETAIDAYLKDQAIEYMRQNKGRTALLYCKKLLNYFSPSRKLATVSQGTSLSDLIMLATYGGLLLLVVARLAFYRLFPLSGLEALCLILYCVSGLAYAVFFTTIRFRLPFDYLLIVVAAIFLDRITRTYLLKEEIEGP